MHRLQRLCPQLFVVFLSCVFFLTCAFSTYAHAEAHHAVGPCQGMSEDKDGCLWSDKLQSLPASTIPHEPSGADVHVERADLPQQEAPPSHDLWQSLLSRSPPIFLPSVI